MPKKYTNDVLITPIYSDGTDYGGQKNNMGQVEGPKGGKPIPDSTGYLKGFSGKRKSNVSKE